MTNETLTPEQEIPFEPVKVLDRLTGEMIAVHAASNEDLAQFMINLGELRGDLSDAEATVSTELVERRDKDGEWTLHLIVDGKDVTIKADSPTAGTVSYPEDQLDPALSDLVQLEVISEKAARGALKRQLVVTLDVPFGADMNALSQQILSNQQMLVGKTTDGAPVFGDIVSVDRVRKSVSGGITKISKNPAVAERLESVKVVASPKTAAERRAKVTVA